MLGLSAICAENEAVAAGRVRVSVENAAAGAGLAAVQAGLTRAGSCE